MKMRINRVLNLTPHAVKVVTDDGSTMVYQPEPTPARVSTSLRRVGTSEVPMFEEVYGDVQDLPDEEFGTILIVSGLVCSALPERHDLVHPVGLVRDDEGHVIGCRGFAPVTVVFDYV